MPRPAAICDHTGRKPPNPHIAGGFRHTHKAPPFLAPFLDLFLAPVRAELYNMRMQNKDKNGTI